MLTASKKMLLLVLCAGFLIGFVSGWFLRGEVFHSTDNEREELKEITTQADYSITPLDKRGADPASRKNLFQHDRFGFSLEVPADLEVRRFDEEGGAETIVFQKPGETHGFQIFILPYMEETITEERIRADIPSGLVEEPMEVMIGKNKDIRAMAFLSENPIMGPTREVWFIRDGYLYEVTTYRSLDEWLAKIMDTLEF